jgi:uncharacterized OB-fold protein
MIEWIDCHFCGNGFNPPNSLNKECITTYSIKHEVPPKGKVQQFAFHQPKGNKDSKICSIIDM